MASQPRPRPVSEELSTAERVLGIPELAAMIIKGLYDHDALDTIASLHAVNRWLYSSTLPYVFQHATLSSLSVIWHPLHKYILRPTLCGPSMEIGSKSSVPSATAHVKVLDVDGRVILKDLACIQERFQWTRLDALRLLSHRSESYSWDLRPSEPCFQAKTVIYFANLQHLVPHSINVEAPLVVINFSWVADLNKLAMASMTRKFRIGSPWRLVLIIGTDEHPLDFLPPFRRSIRYLFEHITSPTRRLPQLTVVGLEKLNRGTVQSDFRRQALLYFDCIGCPFGLKCPGYTQATSEMRDAHVVDFISRDEYLVQLSPREQRLHTVDYPSAIAPIRPIVDPGEADLIRFEEVYGFTNSSGSDSPSSGSGTERT